MISRHFISQLLVCAGLITCKNEAPRAPEPSTELATNVSHRPLADCIPSAGLRWLVQIRPQELTNHPAFQRDWQVVFEADRVTAFTKASGFDPHKVTEAWIGGYDMGVLYLFDARATGDAAEKAFLARALSSQEVVSPYPNLVHFTGLIENTPHALLHVRGHLIAIATGDIQLARIVRAYVERKLKRSPPALRSRFLEAHAHFEEDSLVRLFLRGPVVEATDKIVAGVVSGVGAVALGDSTIELKTQVLGAWPFESHLAESLTHWAHQVLATREMRALGWGFPTTLPEVTCDPHPEDLALCRASGSWDSAAIANSLYRVTAGSIKELVEEPQPGWYPKASTQQEDEN